MDTTSPNSFAGKRALVTGGNRGIGLAIARALYKKGAHVIVAARNVSLLAQAAQEMPEIETIRVDLTSWKLTEEAIRNVLPIQLLVNNAGIAITKPFGQFEEIDFDITFKTNIQSIVNISQIVANDLKARKLPGSIVNVSSIASILPAMNHSIYGSSKSAVDNLTMNMALELGPYQIRVNTVNPTIVMTDMGKELWGDPAKSGPMLKRIPLGRFAEVTDVANAVLFLLSDESSFLTGTIFPVDGGLRCG